MRKKDKSLINEVLELTTEHELEMWGGRDVFGHYIRILKKCINTPYSKVIQVFYNWFSSGLSLTEVYNIIKGLNAVIEGDHNV